MISKLFHEEAVLKRKIPGRGFITFSITIEGLQADLDGRYTALRHIALDTPDLRLTLSIKGVIIAEATRIVLRYSTGTSY
jgi:hypothetical protein